MATCYEIRVDGELRATYSADFCEASSPLLMDGDSTPFQVADAQHCPEKAADLLIAWGDNQGCPIVADGETVTDLQGDIIDPVDLDKAVTQFMLDSRQSGVMHTGASVGDVVA